jgi:hypothetical protein
MPLEGSPDFNSVDKNNMRLELPKGFMSPSVPDLPPMPPVFDEIEEAVLPLDSIVQDVLPLDSIVQDVLPLDSIVQDVLPLDSIADDLIPLDSIVEEVAVPAQAMRPAKKCSGLHKTSKYIDKRVTKIFHDGNGKERPFKGVVQSYDQRRRVFLVRYEDGDSEDMSIKNVFRILDSPGFESDDSSVASSKKENEDGNNAKTDEQEEVEDEEDEPLANLVHEKREAEDEPIRRSRKRMKRVMHDV